MAPSTQDRSPWWDAGVHAGRRPALAARARIKSAIRAWFEAQGFIEVETACLQVSPGNEAHLQAFKTELQVWNGERRPVYLHTSPEFACKKLLAAGETRIFTFAPVFRNGELSALHHPEFTMLEWYRAGEPYQQLWQDCADILKIAAEVADNRFVSWRGRTSNPNAKARMLTVAQAFRLYAGVDLLATLTPQGADREAFSAQAQAIGITVSNDDDWHDIFAKVLTAFVEPQLGLDVPAILYEYPSVEAALAKVSANNPRVAERFELYVSGVELANGFGELTDAEEQRRRFGLEMAKKSARYGESYPIDEDLLAALAVMPPASGCALGFDRLVMLATGATRIEQVIWTPVAEQD